MKWNTKHPAYIKRNRIVAIIDNNELWEIFQSSKLKFNEFIEQNKELIDKYIPEETK